MITRIQFLQLAFILLFSISEVTSFHLLRVNVQSPVASPSLDPQPFLPLLAPSPLMPFTTVGMPNLSGKCPLNFSYAESVLTTTATDCWGSLAPYLANVVCCPQLDTTINILIAQSSFSTGTLAISETQANNCLSDITQILISQGSNENIFNICKIYPSNVTQASCPIVDMKEIENNVNVSMIIESCESINLVRECRHKVCERAITNAAIKIASNNYSMPGMVGSSLLHVRVVVIDDCKMIILRWLASKFDTTYASKLLRGISSCKINKVCPLVFPDMTNVTEECGNISTNQTACCDAMENYITRLQDQSFVTNLQALNCASSLATNMQKANVSINVYDICRVKLKDFSLQDSGCLFPSLPFDVTYDESSGIGLKCDLNDNVVAPWPSSNAYSHVPSSNISIEFPALPKATSDQREMLKDCGALGSYSPCWCSTCSFDDDGTLFFWKCAFLDKSFYVNLYDAGYPRSSIDHVVQQQHKLHLL